PQQVRSRIEIKGRTGPPRLSGGQYRCSSHEKSSGRVSELLVRSASMVFCRMPVVRTLLCPEQVMPNFSGGEDRQLVARIKTKTRCPAAASRPGCCVTLHWL